MFLLVFLWFWYLTSGLTGKNVTSVTHWHNGFLSKPSTQLLCVCACGLKTIFATVPTQGQRATFESTFLGLINLQPSLWNTDSHPSKIPPTSKFRAHFAFGSCVFVPGPLTRSAFSVLAHSFIISTPGGWRWKLLFLLSGKLWSRSRRSALCKETLVVKIESSLCTRCSGVTTERLSGGGAAAAEVFIEIPRLK